MKNELMEERGTAPEETAPQAEKKRKKWSLPKGKKPRRRRLIAGAAVILAAALAEFFLFDIPDIFALESGMAVRKWLRQIEGSGKEAKREAFVIERDIMVVHTDERTDG